MTQYPKIQVGVPKYCFPIPLIIPPVIPCVKSPVYKAKTAGIVETIKSWIWVFVVYIFAKRRAFKVTHPPIMILKIKTNTIEMLV
mmetsp:Transcript_18440/g.16303  ORF Transcript_18440/g.16303 Transcript_18440/m.16303 type:complete len:85 (-) Transcript_18440:172-426(-)